MIIPESAVKYIRWQRTKLRVAKCPDPEEVKRKYSEWIEDDFKSMLPYLPEKVDSILDVGCGLAGIDVFLKQKYPDAKLYLLDGDGENIVAKGKPDEAGAGGWNMSFEPFNSRAVTEEFLEANGIKVDKWFDINTREVLAADLIVSLHSWGYHYPLAIYSAKGTVISDFRRDCETPRGIMIYEGPKYDRRLWKAD